MTDPLAKLLEPIDFVAVLTELADAASPGEGLANLSDALQRTGIADRVKSDAET
jgi:hypothetical protein